LSTGIPNCASTKLERSITFVTSFEFVVALRNNTRALSEACIVLIVLLVEKRSTTKAQPIMVQPHPRPIATRERGVTPKSRPAISPPAVALPIIRLLLEKVLLWLLM